MASRSAFGFRSAKQTERASESKERAPMGLSRKSSITSTASDASRFPPQPTSFFSRSKSRVKGDPSTSKLVTSGIPVGRVQSSAKIGSSQSEPGSMSMADQSRSAGLGISTMNQITATQPLKSGKQARNVLRRKAPLDSRGKYARTESSASSYELAPRPSREIASTPETSSDPYAGSVLGISLPTATTAPDSYVQAGMGPSSEFATSSSRMASFKSRKIPPPSTTPSLPPVTSTFVHDSGSSTRRSESPGNFSRTSTPTSMSSQSPGIGTPVKPPVRWQTSPTRSRPPVTRRRFPAEDIHPSQSRGLTAVRESATSSSSSSTIKASEQRRDGSQVRSDRSTPLPPSPPTRQTSKRLVPPEELGLRREMLRDVPEQGPGSAAGVQSTKSEPSAVQGDLSHFSRFKYPPPRPSREGTPRLDDAFEPSPVIRTRLPPLQTSGHRRRLSSDKDASSADSKSSTPYGLTPLGRSMSNASSTSFKPSRVPSPNPLIARPPRTNTGESSREQIAATADTKLPGIHSPREPSPLLPSSNKSSSRFGLFTKRTRSPLELAPVDSGDKGLKKGPAAGTGHEGYGKYSRRGRSGSTSTSASRGRSTSATSAGLTSTSRKSSFTSRDEPMDDFLSARLAPVVIPGGGRAADSPYHGSAHYPTISGDSSVAMTSSEDVSIGDPSSSQQYPIVLSTEASNIHHLRRDYRRLPHRQEQPGNMFEQQREILDPLQNKPTLAARRSAHRSQVFGQETQPMKHPAPIDVRAMTVSPGMDSRDTVQSSVRTDVSDDISEGREGNWLKSRRTEKRAKSPRKWNFFQRAQASPRRPVEPSVTRSEDDPRLVKEVPIAASHFQETRPVPFYALLEGSEQEGLDQMGPSSAAGTTQPSTDNSAMHTRSGTPEFAQRQEHGLSTLLPSPPKLSAEFPSLSGPVSPPSALQSPEVIPVSEMQQPPPEPKKPRLQQVGRIPRVISKRDRLHKPPPQSFSRPFARSPVVPNEPLTSISVPKDTESVVRPPLGIQTETIPFARWSGQGSAKPASAPVHQSESFNGMATHEFLAFPQKHGSQMSGVSGSSSSGILSFAATTAVVPEPGTALEEDEVWNEYNEFLDTVSSSPAQLSNESRNPLERTLQKSRLAPSPLKITKEDSVTSSPERVRAPNLPPSSAPTRPLPSPPDRSKLLSPGFPPSPGTISDLLAGYGDRNRSSGISQRKSGYTASRYSTSSIESDAMSFTGQEPSISQATGASQAIEYGYGNDLRLNALMTSRWLSLDRVLFSPAHMEIESNRVLVLDGLGNDDWSFYCAETYKDTSVFNLSPTPSRPQQENAKLKLPKNHRQIQLTSLENRFPFPPEFFAAAVLRFPAATTESAYSNAISECMRVLRPGGYLETSILDLDLVNMGNKARKALRDLKLRMSVAHPGVTLKPLSENIQKMLKRSGFDSLQRVPINLPVAGVVSNSRSNSMDARSTSLEDLQKDTPKQGDGDLAKTLPQVARWWFTRCYEMVSMPHDDMERSIWNDKSLLEECEKKETGLKLLLCHAQKPRTSEVGSSSTSRAINVPLFRRL